MIVSVN